MSVDQDSERSLLERKDRADLVAMATALGEKPPARAKKATIVDLILRLTNVASTSSPSDGDPAGPLSPRSDGSVTSGPDDASSEPTTEPLRDPGESSGPDPEGAGTVRTDTPGVDTDPALGGTSGPDEAPANGRLDLGIDEQQASGAGASFDDATARSQPAPADDRPVHDDPAPSRRDADGRTDAAQRQGGGGERSGPGPRPGPRAPQQGQGQAQGQGNGNGNGNRSGQPSGSPNAVGSPNAAATGSALPERSGADPNGSGGQSASDRPNHQPSPGPRAEEGEGNRRRRRRGRDRDRPGNEGDEGFAGEPVEVEGLLDLRDEGYGFLRVHGYLPSRDDVYVSVKQARQFALRKGDRLRGKSRPANRNEKNPALLQIDLVNGVDPEQARQRPRFEDLTPLFPDERFRLERADEPADMTARIVDLIAPVGKGQRGLIVSPPKAGKTTVMKQIARAIEINHPEVELIVLLVDERPEEVTDMKRWLRRGEVAASTFDRPSEEHTQVAEVVIERAKRMVEDRKDVVIILDGITRLARAYNLAAPATGRIMSGGIDTGALYPPKKFFGAARNVEEGGSLTILATALVETGSRMDEVIFEEFKGTGNMELKLDRRLADRRIYPAIDVDASSTRHEELLFERKQLQQVWRLRRVLSTLSSEGASSAAGLELLIDRMKTFRSNDEFLAEVAKAASV